MEKSKNDQPIQRTATKADHPFPKDKGKNETSPESPDFTQDKKAVKTDAESHEPKPREESTTEKEAPVA